MHIVLYGKPRCSLCDHARDVVEEVVEELAGHATADLTCLDITANPMLMQRYRHEIPVVTVDGEELFKLRIDPAALRSRLLQQAQPTRGYAS